MSLSKTLYPLLSTGSTQEVDWDEKNQNKQTLMVFLKKFFF